MLIGKRVGLRARQEEDVTVLHTELYDDIDTQTRTSARPWRPLPVGSPASPYAPADSREDLVCFSAVQLDNGGLIGAATLWGIDSHNRLAHLGVTLRPRYRGRGLAADVLRALCHYGFAIRGLNRLQIETLADNTPMTRAATRVGFVHEGTFRQSAWVGGVFLDEMTFGLLRDDWEEEGTRGRDKG